MSEDYYQNLPKKRMGVGCLFFNENGELLIVKPSYKDHWSIPGGVIEENESPLKTCVREVEEEIGIDLKSPKFLCVDYSSNSGKGESLQFIFYGKILNQEEIENIKLAEGELLEYKFLRFEEALPILNEKLVKRLQECIEAIKNKQPIYLEDGEYV